MTIFFKLFWDTIILLDDVNVCINESRLRKASIHFTVISNLDSDILEAVFHLC